MIETTYVRLEKAAAMLETDTDTLLIAAIEGRLRLWGLLCGEVRADGIPGNGINIDAEAAALLYRDGHSFPDFVQLERMELPNLLRNGTCNVFSFEWQGVFWQIYPDRHEVPTVTRDHLYMMREDVNSIVKNAATPPPDSISRGQAEQRKSDLTKKRDTLLVIIAALAHTLKIDLDLGEGGAKIILTCTNLLGVSLSESTILDVIKEIPEAVRRRSK